MHYAPMIIGNITDYKVPDIVFWLLLHNNEYNYIDNNIKAGRL